jgi:hypothetical protein
MKAVATFQYQFVENTISTNPRHAALGLRLVQRELISDLTVIAMHIANGQ